ncbi:MAG: hypothetical protein EAX81_00930 [Candidatus Thorarchaeota archaeon]|nr:hypothetical protein [Candidatus Thorarchaeota archaeon]
MNLSDLLLLLHEDFRKSFRVGRVKGKRTEQKSTLRRFFPVIGGTLVALFIIWIITTIVPLFGWPFVAELISENLGIGATIFNAILLFSFIGSIMVSASTVGNSSKMEYVLIMPISMRTIFLEKTIYVILYNSILWQLVGVSIFIGLSIASSSLFAFLSIPVFVVLVLGVITIGVSLGGLLGLLFSKLLAGRRTLKQIGWFLGSAAAIVVSVFYYYAIYSSDSGELFQWLFAITNALGFSSDMTPGYAVSALSLSVLVGVPIRIQDVLMGLVFLLGGVFLVYLNAVVSEKAHYSGWLASGSKRTSAKLESLSHATWNPQPIPGFTFNQTVSVSIWYNIASIRREGRVLAQYLVGPLRFVIFLILPVFAVGEEAMIFTPFLILAALIPFAISYGVYFAGYEIVYEGKNIMTLQLAAANMADYIKGKVYSAVPFVIAATVIISVIIIIIDFSLLPYLPAVAIAAVFINVASGAIAANAAAIGGDFKAERIITRQRGSAVQQPIRGWSIVRAQVIPYILGYAGVFGMLGIGTLVGAVQGALIGILSVYIFLPIYAAICYFLFRRYSHSAGVKLAQIEASKYL